MKYMLTEELSYVRDAVNQLLIHLAVIPITYSLLHTDFFVCNNCLLIDLK